MKNLKFEILNYFNIKPNTREKEIIDFACMASNTFPIVERVFNYQETKEQFFEELLVEFLRANMFPFAVSIMVKYFPYLMTKAMTQLMACVQLTITRTPYIDGGFLKVPLEIKNGTILFAQFQIKTSLIEEMLNSFIKIATYDISENVDLVIAETRISLKSGVYTFYTNAESNCLIMEVLSP